MFYIDSMVQGYYDYQSIWDNPLADGDLLCELETGNSHDLGLSYQEDVPCKLLSACQGKYLQSV